MLANGVKETTTTTGTGTITLSAASGFARFSDWCAVGEFVDYAIESGSDREWGVGRVAAGNTFERTIVTATITSGTLAKYPDTGLSLSGTSTVFCTAHSATVGPSRGGNTMGTLAPGVVSSAHLVSTADFGSSVSASAGNRLQWVPFVWPPGCRRHIASLKVYVTATGTATKMRIGILKPLGDTLGSLQLLTQTEDISIDTTGAKTSTLSSPIVVPENRFMMVIIADGSVSLRAADGVIGDPYNNVYAAALYARPQVWNAETDAGWTSITNAMCQRDWMVSGDSAKQVMIWVGQ